MINSWHWQGRGNVIHGKISLESYPTTPKDGLDFSNGMLTDDRKINTIHHNAGCPVLVMTKIIMMMGLLEIVVVLHSLSKAWTCPPGGWFWPLHLSRYSWFLDQFQQFQTFSLKARDTLSEIWKR